MSGNLLPLYSFYHMFHGKFVGIRNLQQHSVWSGANASSAVIINKKKRHTYIQCNDNILYTRWHPRTQGHNYTHIAWSALLEVLYGDGCGSPSASSNYTKIEGVLVMEGGVGMGLGGGEGEQG